MFSILKIKFTDHMKLKKEVWMFLCHLEEENEYSQEELWGQNVEHRPKERPFRDCPTWRSIPYAFAKPRFYCRCWGVLVDGSLIVLSPEILCQNLKNTESNGHSQTLTRARGPWLQSYRRDWCGLLRKQPCQSARTSLPQDPRDRPPKLIHMEEPKAPAKYEAEDVLVWTSVGGMALGPEWIQCPNAVEC